MDTTGVVICLQKGIAETLRITIYWTRAYTGNANDNRVLGDINNIIR